MPCDWLRCRRCGCRTLHSPQMFAHQVSVYVAFSLAGWSRARCLVPRRGCCAILARGRRRRCCLGDFRRLICRLLCLRRLPRLQGLQQKFQQKPRCIFDCDKSSLSSSSKASIELKPSLTRRSTVLAVILCAVAHSVSVIFGKSYWARGTYHAIFLSLRTISSSTSPR